MTYQKSIENWRSEFPQLEKNVYLDHAASTLCPKSVLDSILKKWSSDLYSNPHSKSNSGKDTKNQIDLARDLVRQFFNAPDYEVIFTLNATHSMKIVGECFGFCDKSNFATMRHVHNSALGVREYAYQRGATVSVLDLEDVPIVDKMQNNLFVFTAECNFSGVKFPLESVANVQEKGWYVLVDAAKFCSTNALNLTKVSPEFVAVSFYKIFGFPTGLGCLLVHKNASNLLEKKYFSGGTIESSVVDERFHVFRKSLHERLEDGTLPYHNIISLLDILSIPKLFKFSMMEISKHTFYLAHYLFQQINSMKHYNGKDIAVFYGNHHLNTSDLQGSIVTFNLLDEGGEYIGHSQVEQFACMENISIRTGCFCNPGACQKYLSLSSSQVKSNHKKGHVCWDDKDIVDGYPIGAVRVSFGYCSIKNDADRFIDFLTKYFVVKERKILIESEFSATLSHIIVYPIKSCLGCHVSDWKCTSMGLEFDREWTIIDDSGIALKMNKQPRLGLIQPSFRDKYLILCAPNIDNIEIDLFKFPDGTTDLEVCGAKTIGLLYLDNSINIWLSTVLGQRSHLIRRNPNQLTNSSCENRYNFSNEAPYLLVSKSSLDYLHSITPSTELTSDWLIERFRPNFVINTHSSTPFTEESLVSLTIASRTFQIIGKCNRCTMICVDPKTQSIVYEPLKTLSTIKREKGKINFGILLSGPKEPFRLTRDANIKV